MPRKLRVQYPGGIYRVMKRGHGGAAKARDEPDTEVDCGKASDENLDLWIELSGQTAQNRQAIGMTDKH